MHSSGIGVAGRGTNLKWKTKPPYKDFGQTKKDNVTPNTKRRSRDMYRTELTRGVARSSLTKPKMFHNLKNLIEYSRERGLKYGLFNTSLLELPTGIGVSTGRNKDEFDLQPPIV